LVGVRILCRKVRWHLTIAALTSGLASACAADGSGDESSAGEGAETGDLGESGGEGSGCASGANPSLTIGHGATGYEALEDGGQIELIHGPQGGVHTLMALHAEDIDASEELVGRLEGFLGGELTATSAPYLDMRCNGAEGGLQVWSVLLIWEAAPEALHLQPVTIDAEVIDAQGVKVTATKEAIIHDAMLD
jgi:hypothetical protein